MTVNVPTVGHPASPLAKQISDLQTFITANATKNPQHALAAKNQLPALQQQLVQSLMASGELPASAILSTMTFRAADTN